MTKCIVTGLLLIAVGCGKATGSGPSNDMVLSAIEQISPCTSVQVMGSTQIPNEKSAKVDVKVTGLKYVDAASGRRADNYSGPATATLKQYDSGAWILSELSAGPTTFPNLQVPATVLPAPSQSPSQTLVAFFGFAKQVNLEGMNDLLINKLPIEDARRVDNMRMILKQQVEFMDIDVLKESVTNGCATVTYIRKANPLNQTTVPLQKVNGQWRLVEYRV